MSKDKYRHKSKFIRIGQNIRRIRKLNNLSQEKLAFEIESNRNYIGCIERSEKIPSINVLFDLADALKVDINQFFI